MFKKFIIESALKYLAEIVNNKSKVKNSKTIKFLLDEKTKNTINDVTNSYNIFYNDFNKK